MNDKKFSEIFENDPFGLLKLDESKKQVGRSEDQRLIESFEEISNFYEEYNREPNSEGIEEFTLHARLKAIRANPSKVKTLLSLDYYNLLDSESNKSVTITDIILDDPLGILNNDTIDESIFDLKYIKKSARIRPDYLARRTKCKNFELYEDMFSCIQEELKDRQRKLVKFNSLDIEIGKFYVLNGVLLYLENVKSENNEYEYKSGMRTRLDGRTRCIFDNGTESTMLLRSLVKALDLDGFRVGDSVVNNKNEVIIDDFDEQNGFIYILKSKSPLPEISSIQDLHKIGYTTGNVDNRIKNARKEPTYLMADVKVVSIFRCFNMNTNKLEIATHSFFNNVRLNIEIIDYSKKKYHPREWFKVPLDVIEEVVELIVNDDIDKYIYDEKLKTIIIK